MASQFQGEADRRRVEDQLLRYVGIHSVNPAIDNGPGEAEAANAVEADLRALGLSPTRETIHPGGRDNITALLPGRAGSPVVMFQAHMDTVGLSGKATADATSSDGFVYGRGACDTKGSLVAMLESLRLLQAVPVDDRATILFAGGIDEEVYGTGADELTKAHPEIDFAVVGEPTSLEMGTAHKGVLRFEIATTGVPAHSSKPHLGVNAINSMAKVLAVLESDYISGLDPVGHPLVGPGTFNVSTITGGTALNVVPAECVISVDRRVIPGEDHDQLLEEFDEILGRIEGVTLERRPPFLATAPLDTPVDNPVVTALGRARKALLGSYGDPIGMTYGTDASFFGPAGIGCVIFGPGSIDQAHSDEEWVEIEETAQAAEILAQVAIEMAG